MDPNSQAFQEFLQFQQFYAMQQNTQNSQNPPNFPNFNPSQNSANINFESQFSSFRPFQNPNPNQTTFGGYVNPDSVQDAINLDDEIIPVIPEISTQQEPFVVGSSTSIGRKGKAASVQWTLEEDYVLLSAWEFVSTDPIVGNSQKSKRFFERIAENYNQFRPPNTCERGDQQLRGRWRRIDSSCRAFSGCYSAAVKAQPSGTNERDLMLAAGQLYLAKERGKFGYEHCWQKLKNLPQWLVQFDEDEPIVSMPKRTKNDAAGGYTSGSTPGTPGTTPSTPGTDSEESPMMNFACQSRPLGTKAAKRKGKTKVDPNESERLQTIKEFAEKKGELEKIRMEEKRKRRELKREAMDYQMLYADTSHMNEWQKKAHAKQCQKILDRLELDVSVPTD